MKNSWTKNLIKECRKARGCSCLIPLMKHRRFWAQQKQRKRSGVSDAIGDFLHGMNQCRGIVASRQFRGPGQSSWPHFRILPLSEKRRQETRFAKPTGNSKLEPILLGQIGMANDEIRGMGSNPMFLGLLCEYVREGHPFPENAHSVFETYIEHRLTRDTDRLQRRFAIEVPNVRAVAESVAFCMAADSTLGLAHRGIKFKCRCNDWVFKWASNFPFFWMRWNTSNWPGQKQRLPILDNQELLLLLIVDFKSILRHVWCFASPTELRPSQLLTDAHWRETTVSTLPDSTHCQIVGHFG